MYGSCVVEDCFFVCKGIWKVPGKCLYDVWNLNGRCLEAVWKVFVRCLEGGLKGVLKSRRRCLRCVLNVSGW